MSEKGKIIRSILTMAYQRDMEIWHNGTQEQRAVLLNREVQEFIKDLPEGNRIEGLSDTIGNDGTGDINGHQSGI